MMIENKRDNKNRQSKKYSASIFNQERERGECSTLKTYKLHILGARI
jgi:hypothetical protein